MWNAAKEIEHKLSMKLKSLKNEWAQRKLREGNNKINENGRKQRYYRDDQINQSKSWFPE